MNPEGTRIVRHSHDHDRDTTPANPPPSAVAGPEQKGHEEYSNFSLFNNDDLGDELESAEEDHLDEVYKCIPHACPQELLRGEDDAASSSPNLSELPSVASILDYEIVQGLLKPGIVKTETEAFVPIGGMVAPEKKRQEFHDYLHRKGFISGIAKALISLYDEPELPPKETAGEYLSKCLGFHLKVKTEIDEAESYANILQQRIRRLEVENDWMRRHLDNYEASETPLDTVDPASLPPIEHLELEHHHTHHHHHKNHYELSL